MPAPGLPPPDSSRAFADGGMTMSSSGTGISFLACHLMDSCISRSVPLGTVMTELKTDAMGKPATARMVLVLDFWTIFFKSSAVS